MATLLKLSLLLALACLVSAQARRKNDHDYIVNPYVCVPGEGYYLDCNFCKCHSNGASACTLMACNVGRDDCIPGSVFEISGQLCKCPECGYKWHSDCFASNYCPKQSVGFARDDAMDISYS